MCTNRRFVNLWAYTTQKAKTDDAQSRKRQTPPDEEGRNVTELKEITESKGGAIQ